MESIQDFLNLNKAHSERFFQQKHERDEYRQKHPTAVMVIGCMDDRVNFPVITDMPFGIVRELRTAGGKFSFRVARFRQRIQTWNSFEKGKRRNRLVIVTKHRSNTHRELGCKAFGYDEREAMATHQALRKEFDYIYEDEPDFYALNCTIETDEGSLSFLGKAGQKLDLSVMLDASPVDLLCELRATYPDMPEHILIDLLPFAVKNILHIKRIRSLKNRSHEEKGHRASVIAVGTGTEWIDGAYIINPADPKFSEAVKIALNLIEKNYRKSGCKPLLLASASFQPPSCFSSEAEREEYSEERYSGYRIAMLEANGLAEDLRIIASETVPDLLSHLERLTTVVNLDTWLATVIG